MCKQIERNCPHLHHVLELHHAFHNNLVNNKMRIIDERVSDDQNFALVSTCYTQFAVWNVIPLRNTTYNAAGSQRRTAKSEMIPNLDPQKYTPDLNRTWSALAAESPDGTNSQLSPLPWCLFLLESAWPILSAASREPANSPTTTVMRWMTKQT